MKDIKYSIIALCLTIVLFGSGCQKKLDINPQDDVEQGEAIKTSKDVQGVLIGAYTAAALRGIYGGRLQATSDFLADDGDFSFFGTYLEYTQMSNKKITNTNLFVEGVWNSGYNTINVCNLVLANIGLVDEANKARVEGEARFLRGMTYFDLVRVFGRAWNDGTPASNLGVPVVLKPTTSIGEIEKVKRNTVAEVYAQAIADLQFAKDSLSDAPRSKSPYANAFTASAVLARIYLTQERYAEAETEADFIISNGGYSLVDNVADEFQDPPQATRVFNTSEDIFAIQISNQSGFNALNEIFSSSDKGGRGETLLNDQFFGRFETDDQRANLIYDDGDIYTSKFNNSFGNVILIRLAEIYLIRAEARIRKPSPDLSGAAEDINIVRNRAGLGDTPAASQDELFDAVKQERRVELAFEGFRLNDIKRYKETTSSVDGDGAVVETFNYNAPELVYPIPKREIDANPNLVQNQGY